MAPRPGPRACLRMPAYAYHSPTYLAENQLFFFFFFYRKKSPSTFPFPYVFRSSRKPEPEPEENKKKITALLSSPYLTKPNQINKKLGVFSSALKLSLAEPTDRPATRQRKAQSGADACFPFPSNCSVARPGVESRRMTRRRRKRDKKLPFPFFSPLGPGGASCVCCAALPYISCKCVIGAPRQKGRKKKEPRTFYSTT